MPILSKREMAEATVEWLEWRIKIHHKVIAIRRLELSEVDDSTAWNRNMIAHFQRQLTELYNLEPEKFVTA